MPNTSELIQAQLAQLRQDYVQRLESKLHAIEAGWNQLSPVWSGETSRTLHHLLHTLAGSSATYGFA
ncbi:Hpt domain-containing protein, partial [Leptolyngbya sp. FACHB-36]